MSKKKLLSKEIQIYLHDSQELLPKNIIEDMKWFLLRGIMLHAADNIECPEDHLKLLLKVFSMFKIMVIYDETIYIYNKDVPESVGIMCINCGKIIGCSLYNQNMEKLITPFVTNMAFQNIGLFCIIRSKQF